MHSSTEQSGRSRVRLASHGPYTATSTSVAPCENRAEPSARARQAGSAAIRRSWAASRPSDRVMLYAMCGRRRRRRPASKLTPARLKYGTGTGGAKHGAKNIPRIVDGPCHRPACTTPSRPGVMPQNVQIRSCQLFLAPAVFEQRLCTPTLKIHVHVDGRRPTLRMLTCRARGPRTT